MIWSHEIGQKKNGKRLSVVPHKYMFWDQEEAATHIPEGQRFRPVGLRREEMRVTSAHEPCT